VIDGSALRNFYINAWRNIPELVAACNGDDGLIRTHSGPAKIAKSLEREVLEMPEGAIFVAYMGLKPGLTRKGQVTLHEIAAFIRAMTPDDDTNIPFAALMLDGVPANQTDNLGLPVRYLVPHIDADPMEMPRFERVGASQLTIDIWKLSFGIVENFA
jgi:hypothetical protein